MPVEVLADFIEQLEPASFGIGGHAGGTAICQITIRQGRSQPFSAQDDAGCIAALGQVGVVQDEGAVLVEPHQPPTQVARRALPPFIAALGGGEVRRGVQGQVKVLFVRLGAQVEQIIPGGILPGDRLDQRRGAARKAPGGREHQAVGAHLLHVFQRTWEARLPGGVIIGLEFDPSQEDRFVV